LALKDFDSRSLALRSLAAAEDEADPEAEPPPEPDPADEDAFTEAMADLGGLDWAGGDAA
jgi:hypothetical protein